MYDFRGRWNCEIGSVVAADGTKCQMCWFCLSLCFRRMVAVIAIAKWDLLSTNFPNSSYLHTLLVVNRKLLIGPIAIDIDSSLLLSSHILMPEFSGQTNKSTFTNQLAVIWTVEMKTRMMTGKHPDTMTISDLYSAHQATYHCYVKLRCTDLLFSYISICICEHIHVPVLNRRNIDTNHHILLPLTRWEIEYLLFFNSKANNGNIYFLRIYSIIFFWWFFLE